MHVTYIKNYLNLFKFISKWCKTFDIIVDRESNLWQRSNINLPVYRGASYRFEHIVQSANNTSQVSYNSLSNLKSYWNERSSCQRSIFSTFLYNMKEMFEFCKFVKLWTFLRYVQVHFTLFNHWYFVSMLVCSKMSKKILWHLCFS